MDLDLIYFSDLQMDSKTTMSLRELLHGMLVKHGALPPNRAASTLLALQIEFPGHHQ